MADLKRYEASGTSWTARQLVNHIRKGTVSFDLAVQRAFVWNKDQQSLFISSLILNINIPEISAIKRNKTYFFIDGKQRATTVFRFMDNKFRLQNVPLFEAEDGQMIDYNGYNFSDLPEEIQDYISGYSFKISIMNDLTDSEEAEYFFRRNSGTPLRPIDKYLAQSRSLIHYMEIGNHPIFEEVYTRRAKELKTHIMTSIKVLILLKGDDRSKDTKYSLDAKTVQGFVKTAELSKKDVKRITTIYDKFLEIHQKIVESPKKFAVKNDVIGRRIYGTVNFITLCPFIETHIDDPNLTTFIMKFFSGEEGTLSTAYNAASTAGVYHSNNVKARFDALDDAWNQG